MILLHNIGDKKHPNYNSVKEILNSDGPLSFDGVYRNVFQNLNSLWELAGRRIILFVMGDYVGRNNSFDTGMPFELFCDWNEIVQICTEVGAQLGWHTWSHRDLTTLTDEEIKEELRPPFPMDYFAYPYGNFDERVKALVKEAGFKEAWSVTQGDGTPLAQKRNYLCTK